MKLSFTLLTTLGALSYCHADAVRLQVKGPNGQPVAGAKVRVVESQLTTQYEDTSPGREFVTDAQGTLSFASKGVLFKEKVPNAGAQSVLTARILVPGLAVKILPLKAGNNVITLAKGQTLEGVTLDADSKSVPHARVVLSSLRDGDTYSWTPRQLQIETRSDAQGRWKIGGLPLTGIGVVQVRDLRYRNETFTLDLKQKAPPFFLQQGAGLKGRLLRPDGTPAQGVRLALDGYGFDSPIVTDANGRFVATGLSRPSVYLQFAPNGGKLAFVAQPRMIENLQVGEVQDIGDWKTIATVGVKGKVVDAQTQKPVANAQIGGKNWGNVVTDKNGDFVVLASPSPFNLSVHAPGFANYSKRVSVTSKTKGFDVGVIALQKGYMVSGVAVDEAGKPASLYLYVNRIGNRDYIFPNEKDGKFTIDSLAPGKYTLGSYGAKIVSGATFIIIKGKDAPPKLRVVIKKGKYDVFGVNRQKQNIVGRVADSDGNPIAGAKVSLSIKGDQGSYGSVAALSQSDGSFSASAFTSKGTASVSRVVRPGYIKGSEQVEVKAGGWRITLTLQKRGQALRGKVVNAQGQGVVGAFVGLQNGEGLPTTTDKEGNFSLLDAPQSGMTLLASNGPSLATFAVAKAGQPIEISLPDVPAINKEELADKILPNTALEYDWGNNWDILGPKRIEALVLKGVGERGGSDWLWVQYLDTLAHRDPKTFLARESELQAATNITGQEDLQRLKMLARAKVGDAAQKEEVRAWLSEEEKSRLDLSMPSVLKLLSVAEVAAQLDPKEGEKWLEYADQIMGQLDMKRGGESVWALGRLAARISPNAPQKLGQDWTLAGQMEILQTAMQTWVADGNLKAVQVGWKQMNALSGQLLKHPAPKPRRGEYVPRPSDLVKQAQASYALLLAKTDLKAALNIFMTLKDTDYRKRGYLLTMARLAVRAKQYDVARTAIKAMNPALQNSQSNVIWGLEIPQSQGGPVSTLAIAEVVQEFDPALANTLWSRDYSKSHSDFADDWRQQNSSDVAYARTRARNWPGESRILLEREWKRRIEALPKKKTPQREYYYEYGDRSLVSLVTAMAKVSPTRALEMVEALPYSERYKARIRLSIVTALLQPQPSWLQEGPQEGVYWLNR